MNENFSVPFNVGYYSRIRLGRLKKKSTNKVARLRPAIQSPAPMKTASNVSHAPPTSSKVFESSIYIAHVIIISNSAKQSHS
jgi:hypothetical protein